jgi:hypothetical protein
MTSERISVYQVSFFRRSRPASVEIPVCRLRYPNGLLIECMSWPTVQWLAKLAGALDVPA